MAVYSPTSFNVDELAVDVVAELFESFCNLEAVYRAEDCACGACLGTDGELNVCDGSSESFGVGFDLGELVGTLALVFGEHLKSRGSSDNGFSEGNEVVAAVTTFYFYYVVLVSKAADVFFKNDFHCRAWL